MVSSLVLKTTKSRSGNQGHPSEDKVKRAFETQFFRVWVRIIGPGECSLRAFKCLEVLSFLEYILKFC